MYHLQLNVQVLLERPFSLQSICLHNKDEIEHTLRRDTYLHLYEIGDLDDYFWPHTTWYSLKQIDHRPVILLYTGLALPVLLGLTHESPKAMKELILSTLPLLPKRLYAHLSEGLSGLFQKDYQVQSHGIFHKMGLTEPSKLNAVGTSEVIHLSEADLPDMERLYKDSYPEHWFEPHMLQSGYYFGVRRNSKLVCVAGVHVHSQTYNVATLGNVATHPDFREQGLAKAACARLCQSLLQTVEHIGLNVKTDNTSAIVCYEKLGFERLALYEECMLEMKGKIA
jgi:GNAT superfamily N-acetyltransferase